MLTPTTSPMGSSFNRFTRNPAIVNFEFVRSEIVYRWVQIPHPGQKRETKKTISNTISNREASNKEQQWVGSGKIRGAIRVCSS